MPICFHKYMSPKEYVVTCLECNESDKIVVDEMAHRVVDYDKKFDTPFLAFRWRTDWTWGFKCQCGNDNRLSVKEQGDFDKLVRGDKESLKKIAASLLLDDNKQFRMETA